MLPRTHSLLSRSVCKRPQTPQFSRFSIWALTFVAVCSPVVRLAAQTSTGEMSVTVFDATGAVVPRASVVIAGTETGNTVRSLATNGLGLASIPLLPPGDYDVTVSAPGFKTSVQKKVVLDVGDVLAVRTTLETGNSSQSVTVTGQTPLVEDRSSLGPIADPRTV